MFSKKFEELEKQKQLLVASETILMRKALMSEDPHALIKAQQYYSERERQQNQSKSIFVDPYSTQNAYGYLQPSQVIDDNTLRRMAKNSPIIKSIIETRIEQIADFLEPQTDKYNTGFIIRRKRNYFSTDKIESKKEDEKKIHLITEFLMRGTSNNELDNLCEGLNSWGRKVMKDSLILDKLSTEIIWNNANTIPVGYIPVDASTIFFANLFNEDGTFKFQEKNVKFAKYVQVLQGQVKNEYFDEEMIFGIRNAQTDLRYRGYGESELESLIGTVTAMLQSDAYNANIFKVGSAPTGIFRLQGNINEARLREFKSNWNNEMTGFGNHGRLAFLEADKMEFQDLSRSNRDMEYSKFQEYLVKLSCAVFKISPEEIGFTLQGAGSKSMFQDSGKEKLKYSKEKGLKPLLTFLQGLINDKIVSKISPDFEFMFTGIEADSQEKETELASKKLASFQSLKEVRKSMGLPEKIAEDDVILNPIWMQWYIQQQQAKMMGNQQSNEFIDDENPFAMQKSWYNDSENPMTKEFKQFVEKEIINDTAA